jgi:hypothetical protein
MIRTLCWLTLAATLSPAGQAAGQVIERTPTAMPMIVMEDQFGRPHFLAAEKEDVVVLVYGDRASAGANQALGAQLHVQYHPAAKGLPPAQASRAPVQPPADWPRDIHVPDVHVVPIACIGKVPSVVAGLIKGQFRSRTPDMAICLDFEDRMRTNFGLAPGVSNVVVVDTRGRVRATAQGNLTNAQVEQLTRLIDTLRQEARQPPPAEKKPGRERPG